MTRISRAPMRTTPMTSNSQPALAEGLQVELDSQGSLEVFPPSVRIFHRFQAVTNSTTTTSPKNSLFISGVRWKWPRTTSRRDCQMLRRNPLSELVRKVCQSYGNNSQGVQWQQAASILGQPPTRWSRLQVTPWRPLPEWVELNCSGSWKKTCPNHEVFYFLNVVVWNVKLSRH
jgi:hypothetical protein